ncbi:MAG: hypothetical protein JSR46_06495, partial [Verrucomicrobia bacterium]|nr:hypothetical protein [Verrucomicrobiota bacterium]
MSEVSMHTNQEVQAPIESHTFKGTELEERTLAAARNALEQISLTGDITHSDIKIKLSITNIGDLSNINKINSCSKELLNLRSDLEQHVRGYEAALSEKINVDHDKKPDNQKLRAAKEKLNESEKLLRSTLEQMVNKDHELSNIMLSLGDRNYNKVVNRKEMVSIQKIRDLHNQAISITLHNDIATFSNVLKECLTAERNTDKQTEKLKVNPNDETAAKTKANTEKTLNNKKQQVEVLRNKLDTYIAALPTSSFKEAGNDKVLKRYQESCRLYDTDKSKLDSSEKKQDYSNKRDKYIDDANRVQVAETRTHSEWDGAFAGLYVKHFGEVDPLCETDNTLDAHVFVEHHQVLAVVENKDAASINQLGNVVADIAKSLQNNMPMFKESAKIAKEVRKDIDNLDGAKIAEVVNKLPDKPEEKIASLRTEIAGFRNSLSNIQLSESSPLAQRSRDLIELRLNSASETLDMIEQSLSYHSLAETIENKTSENVTKLNQIDTDSTNTIVRINSEFGNTLDVAGNGLDINNYDDTKIAEMVEKMSNGTTEETIVLLKDAVNNNKQRLAGLQFDENSPVAQSITRQIMTKLDRATAKLDFLEQCMKKQPEVIQLKVHYAEIRNIDRQLRNLVELAKQGKNIDENVASFKTKIDRIRKEVSEVQYDKNSSLAQNVKSDIDRAFKSAEEQLQLLEQAIKAHPPTDPTQTESLSSEKRDSVPEGDVQEAVSSAEPEAKAEQAVAP